MRETRPKYGELTELQKKKDKARSHANIALRRGQIEKQPCKCGSDDSEMHHPDYDEPLNVEWLCRPCHIKEHA